MLHLKRIIRLIGNPSQLKKQSTLYVRHMLFKARYPFLRQRFSGTEKKDVVLIVNFTDAPYHAKTEGFLAQALHHAGARPVILTQKAYEWSHRYYRLFGINEFLYFDSYLSTEHEQIDRQEIGAFLNSNPTNEELLSYSYDSINIGANALSIALRDARAGTVDLTNPVIKEKSFKTLMRARQAIRAARRMFTEISPKAIIFTEIGYTPHGEIFAAALERGIYPIQYVHSQRLDAITFKRFKTLENLVDPISLSKRTWDMLLQMPWNKEKEDAFMQEYESHYQDFSWFRFLSSIGKKHMPPDELKETLGLDMHKKTAVIFSHVVWDASFYYGTNLFKDFDDWLIETIKVACQNTHVNWVIKLHPDYVWQTKGMAKGTEKRDMNAVQSTLGELPPHIKIVEPKSPISTYSFFKIADYCITVRGTVGLECPCFGIPVIAAGGGRYSNLGFVENSHSVDEYLEKIRTIHSIPPLSPERQTLARKNAYGLYVLRPIVFSSFEIIPVYKHNNVVDHTLAVRAQSIKEVQSDKGLRQFADWVLSSEDEDYVATPG